MPSPSRPSARSTGQPRLRSIGQVLATLKGDFPDISISKIRFLETEGLLAPERAPSGYRRYRESDVARLRYILGVQAEHYLPLKVIREHLDLMDRGMEPPRLQSIRPVVRSEDGTTPAGGDAVVTDVADEDPDGPPAPVAPLRLSRADLLEASGLPEPSLAELERMQIVVPRRGTQTYGRDALVLASAAKKLAEFGVDSRHLRAFKLSSDRAALLVEQAIAPHVRRAAASGSAGSRDLATQTTQLVTQQVIDVHVALIRSAMER